MLDGVSEGVVALECAREGGEGRGKVGLPPSVCKMGMGSPSAVRAMASNVRDEEVKASVCVGPGKLVLRA